MSLDHASSLCSPYRAAKLRFVWAPSSGQFHPNEFAHAALLHRDTIKHIRFCNRAFVVGHDDELALLYEPVQHADKAVDVAFIERRIYFVENAERTRSHHVNCE